MDEVSLVLMEMDAILWLHIGRDIAPRCLFHVDILAEVPLLAIQKDSEIRMMVSLIWSWNDNIGYSDHEENYDNISEDFEKYFHIGLRIKREYTLTLYSFQ